MSQFTLEAKSPADLLKKLQVFDIAVEDGAGKDVKFQKERWQVCRFLSTFAHTGLFRYTLRLEKGESPDFQLCDPDGTIGVECVGAVSQEMAWAQDLRDKNYPDALIFPQPFRPDAKMPPRTKVEAIARGDFAGRPWVGHMAEREWAVGVLHFIEKKRKDASEPSFTLFPRNWLLVYDILPAPIRDMERAVQYLEQFRGPGFRLDPFHRVFVETRSSIVELTDTTTAIHSLTNLWADS